MKSFAAILCATASVGALAGPPSFACPTGGNWVPWQLPAEWYAETPIFAGDQNKHIATVCNCTDDASMGPAGVYVVTIQPLAANARHKEGRILSHAPGSLKPPRDESDPGIPDPPPAGPGNDIYYLQGPACTLVGPGSVILRTANHRAIKWGVWRLESGS